VGSGDSILKFEGKKLAKASERGGVVEEGFVKEILVAYEVTQDRSFLLPGLVGGGTILGNQ